MAASMIGSKVERKEDKKFLTGKGRYTADITLANQTFGYSYFASYKDWYLLPLLKLFQKSDLYSKNIDFPNIEELKSYYNTLIYKFLPNKFSLFSL